MRVKLKPYHPSFEEHPIGCNEEMIQYFGTHVNTMYDIIGSADLFSIVEDNGEWTWTSEWIERDVLPDELFIL